LDYHHEAWERLREAGACLRTFLQDDPRALDLLNDLEEEVVRQTVGWRVLDRAAQRAGEIARREREERRANMKRIPYPSVNRREFDLLGKTPGYPE
jgi:hypothetical protein